MRPCPSASIPNAVSVAASPARDTISVRSRFRSAARPPARLPITKPLP